jgi:hypothetical protein
MQIRDSYDAAAAAYAEHLSDELTHKPLVQITRHVAGAAADVGNKTPLTRRLRKAVQEAGRSDSISSDKALLTALASKPAECASARRDVPFSWRRRRESIVFHCGFAALRFGRPLARWPPRHAILRAIRCRHRLCATAGLARDTSGALANPAYDGILGGDLLGRYRVIIDYPHSRLILEPAR